MSHVSNPSRPITLSTVLQERTEAAAKFGDVEVVPDDGPKTFVPGEGIPQQEPEVPQAKPKNGPTPEQLTAIQAAIANAQTLEEVTMLEEALATGVMPSGLQLGNGAQAMEED